MNVCMYVCVSMYVLYMICICLQFACQHDTLHGTNSVAAVSVRNLHSQFLLQYSTAQHSIAQAPSYVSLQAAYWFETSPQLCRLQCVVLPVDSHIPPPSATAGRCSPSATPHWLSYKGLNKRYEFKTVRWVRQHCADGSCHGRATHQTFCGSSIRNASCFTTAGGVRCFHPLCKQLTTTTQQSLQVLPPPRFQLPYALPPFAEQHAQPQQLQQTP
jgi:hypothetical protein